MLTRRAVLKSMMTLPFAGAAYGGVSRYSKYPFLNIFESFDYNDKKGYIFNPEVLSFSDSADGMAHHIVESEVTLTPRTLRARRESDMMAACDIEACKFLSYIFDSFYQTPIRTIGINDDLVNRVQSNLYDMMTDIYIYEKHIDTSTEKLFSKYNINPLGLVQYRQLQEAHRELSRTYESGDIMLAANRAPGIFLRPTASLKIWEPTLAEIKYSLVCTAPHAVCIARYK